MNSLQTTLTNSFSRRIVLPALLMVAAVAGSAFAQDKATAGSEPKYKTNVKGPADAPIKVVEFADFMCPGCRAASGALHEYFAQQGGDINLTFKNFPLEKTCNPGIGQSIHNGSCELALGSICAADLGMFWPYHDRIFARAWEVATRQDVIDNGVAVGLDKAKFTACLASPAASSKLALQVKEGFEVKVELTPTLVVNGRKLAATNQFSSAVEEERKKLRAAPAPAKK
ncbi:MAG: thioredoxin domain-containing protein [Vicinamibacteria bacterium]